MCFFAASKLLQLNLIPSLFISIALMATSVGISVSIWQEAQALNTDDGELLIDIAEMDDIAAIALMSLFLAMIPVLNGDVEASIVPVFLETLSPFLLKVTFFGIFCLVLFNFLELPMTRFFERLEPAPDPRRIGDIAYGLLDTITAIGLWQKTVWGIFCFLTAIASQFLIYTVFIDYFAFTPTNYNSQPINQPDKNRMEINCNDYTFH